MLELMRKHAGNWIIKVLLGAIALAFALSWGVYNYGDRAREVAFSVNGEPITATQIRDMENLLREQIRAQMGDQAESALRPGLIKQQATNQLVQNILLSQAASQMGVTVADSELAAHLAGMQPFQINGKFNLDLYRRVLIQNRMTPEQYEESLRGQMIKDKLRALVAGSAQVTPQEVREAQRLAMVKVKGLYKLVRPADFMKKAKAEPEELQEYYRKNQNRYLTPETVVLSYLVFPAADYRDEADVQEDDILDLYEMERQKYVQRESAKARQIMLALPEDPGAAIIKKTGDQAKRILAQLKKGADFAALAKQYSQGPNARNGGQMGDIQRGILIPKLDKALFALKPGQLGLVQTRFGFHIIKMESYKPASVVPLEKVRAKLKDQLVERQSSELAAAAAERAFDLAATGLSAAELAKNQKKSLENTGAVEPGGELPGLKGLKGLKEILRDISPGEVLPALAYEGGSVVFYLDKRTPAAPKPFKEVEVQVRQEVLTQKAEALAQKAAADLIAKLSSRADPAKAIKDYQDVKATGWLSKGEGIKGLTGGANLVDALMLCPPQKPVAPRPVAVDGDYVVAVLLERRLPSAQQLKDGLDTFRAQLLAAKRAGVVQRFVMDLRARAEIKVPSKM